MRLSMALCERQPYFFEVGVALRVEFGHSLFEG